MDVSGGQVVANFGPQLLVEDSEGQRHPCRPKGRRLRAVCGDRVEWNRGDGHTGIVTDILPRERELLRPDSRGRIDVLAANFDQLLVVCSPRPEMDPFFVDRYLAAAALNDTPAVVVFNKLDLLDDDNTFAPLLDEYTRIGYPVIRTSAKSGGGLELLRKQLADHTNIFVGKSGVGKSSLLNALIPDLEIATRAVSEATGEGRHTTAAAIMHRLPDGGAVIDSPGVRDYAPPPISESEMQKGYVEFSGRGECRFSDCRHLEEPDCAIKKAVADGEISERRYESYRKLLKKLEKLGSESNF